MLNCMPTSLSFNSYVSLNAVIHSSCPSFPPSHTLTSTSASSRELYSNKSTSCWASWSLPRFNNLPMIASRTSCSCKDAKTAETPTQTPHRSMCYFTCNCHTYTVPRYTLTTALPTHLNLLTPTPYIPHIHTYTYIGTPVFSYGHFKDYRALLAPLRTLLEAINKALYPP